jgi:23S rRNA pseudouridine2605 synthase
LGRLVRLQKFLASAGIASRRKCEELIEEGRAEVNRKAVVSPGVKINPERDEVRCDGEVVHPEKKVYLLLNKPKGFVCSANPQGSESVFQLLKTFSQRLFTVGRLDKDSEGLVILTNDGDFAARCAHPRFGIPKTYRVTVAGRVPNAAGDSLSKGVFTRDGKMSLPDIGITARRSQETDLEVTLYEGKSRHIRRVLAAHHLKVKRLTRTAIGKVQSEELAKGKWRRLTQSEVESIRSDQ